MKKLKKIEENSMSIGNDAYTKYKKTGKLAYANTSIQAYKTVLLAKKLAIFTK